ncbi:MAG: hypothetical protein LC792_20960, partial [Actinobacteria bacterium]|nr:hypothetical protein [Actinomycetota bacterium]
MRVEDARAEDSFGHSERSVRLSWIGGEGRLWVRVPAGLAPPPDDLSAFVPPVLLLAMRRREPLQVDGGVSRRLLDQLAHAQELLSAWDPTYARIPVRAARVSPDAEPAPGRACCFSRGVDSMYSAALPRPPGRDFTHLLYCENLDPAVGEETRPNALQATRQAVTRIGKELIVVSTNVHEFFREVVDNDDGYGAVLAMLGLSLPGAIGRLTIPP